MTREQNTPDDGSMQVVTDIQAVLSILDPYIEEQAKWVADLCDLLYMGRIDWQDIAQAARIQIWHYSQQHPETPLPLLFSIARLRMYGEPHRGRSVDRPHPGKRKNRYQRTSLDEVTGDTQTSLQDVPFTEDEEQALLERTLAKLRLTRNEHGEHLLLLALQRFARDTGREDLYADAHQQWQDWWRRHRASRGETKQSDPEME